MSAIMAHVGEREIGDQFLTDDVLHNVLDRVDGVTLARASCVSTQFRSAGSEEALWKKLCNDRWPSTMEEPVKSLVSTVGGFRKFYNSCFPFVSCDLSRGCATEEDEDNEGAVSATDFVSIVDVTYNGEPVLPQVVQGVPGAIAVCGPLVDILGAVESEAGAGYGEGISKADDEGPVVTIHTNFPRMSSVEQEQKDSRFWADLCSNFRLSWILINKKTKRMVNLGSWRALDDIVHQTCGDDFLLRFGSILPTSLTPVHCNISMWCTATSTSRPVESDSEAEISATTVVKLTELSMCLEDVHCAHLRGSQAISLLSRVMTCDKTTDESKLSASFRTFMATQISNQASLIRCENRRQAAGAIFFVSIIVMVMFFAL